MKLRLVVILLAIFTLSLAASAQDKPALDLKVYPGGESSMEINMGNEDILPMLKAMLPMLSGKMGAVLDKLDPNDLAAILKDVTQIEMIQVDISKSGVAEKDVADFYGKNIPAGQWNRVFWQAAPTGTVAVYSQAGAEALYGFRVRTIKNGEQTVKRAEVAKIQGKIDYVKLIQLAGKLGLDKK
ncbi:MAG: hypothetical protein ABFD54_06755 [Armatimonadota bacterium]|nr:hypothetical protein [bacterium]